MSLMHPENRLSGNRINGPEDEKLICESLSDFGIIGFVPKQEEIVKAGRTGRKVCEDIHHASKQLLDMMKSCPQ
jgi:CO dehydrogenase maturation factor